MKASYFLAASGLVAAPSMAAGIDLSIEIPRLQVAEYHKPYVAVWIEDDGRKAVANLDVWYDTDMRGGEGEKWLSDMRLWWRRAGRSLDMPVDGVSGPTQGPGTHEVSYTEGRRPLGDLKPGKYTLVVEAAREVGGRETVSIPFQWPPQRAQTLSGEGDSELRAIKLTLKP
ncbi:hypothetical protein B5C34_15410 [Pacificimonas flava]|uniref:DUF2271 domain-containing protein n=2 Tax=Pacificimonas TaxID=1960290 RepID=A0A219B188_9SPHN|nr:MULTISPECIES: DUF2271 domain-containing protein [Pacificimonas]MBZ6379648.1 DUF2271 domain-containing protein [Pacificimonas aurantium]OWV31886.1 hypothetical protein B5C34_15410 [Pacificimonas flava]